MQKLVLKTGLNASICALPNWLLVSQHWTRPYSFRYGRKMLPESGFFSATFVGTSWKWVRWKNNDLCLGWKVKGSFTNQQWLRKGDKTDYKSNWIQSDVPVEKTTFQVNPIERSCNEAVSCCTNVTEVHLLAGIGVKSWLPPAFRAGSSRVWRTSGSIRDSPNVLPRYFHWWSQS
jgi:hypothetical protein